MRKLVSLLLVVAVVAVTLAPAAPAFAGASSMSVALLGHGAGGNPGGATAGGPAVALPFAGHNCDPADGRNDKLLEALDAGFRHIEVDVTYDARRSAVVVTHDEAAESSDPELDEYLRPLWARWSGSSGSACTLILDCKTGSGPLVAAIDAVLERHEAEMSSMAVGGTFRARRMTACLSGSGDAKRAYRDLAECRKRYLAFADVVYGEESWKDDVAGYVPTSAPGYVRFLTLHSQNVCRQGAASGVGEHVLSGLSGLGRTLHLVGGADPRKQLSDQRLAALARAAAGAGYAVRLYTINASVKSGRILAADWQRCASAGIPMIATDDCRLAAQWWRSRQS